LNKRLRSKLSLAATIVMFALTAALITRNDQYIFLNEGRLTVEPEPGDDSAVVFTWRSEVEVPMARRMDEAFDEWKGRTDRIVIELHSPGGAVREGEEVIRVIERMKRTHIVDTRVGPRRSCYSMCVPIFLKGEVRTASPSSRFMFHEPTAYDYFTGERMNEPRFEKEMAARRFADRYFANTGMDPDWRENLVSEWRGKDIWKTGRDLVDESSGVVTVLE
jgi:ATP-dependent protease ClpP protease subunit